MKASLKSVAAAGLMALGLALVSFVLSVPTHAQQPAPPASLNEAQVPIALLLDADTGQVLFSRNVTRRFVPASMTKVMTLYTAFELIDSGQLDLRQSLTVSPKVWREWRAKGSSMFLNADERVPLSDLLTGIATVSANDAAIVVADEAAGSVPAWTAQMNAKARAIGMTQSHFGTPNGWPDEGRTFTTASDLVTLGRALVNDHPDKFARFVGITQFRYQNITQSNRDPMIDRVEGADGIKTGYTNESGFGYLGTAKRGSQRLMLVVGGANSNSSRARAARDLIEWGFGEFERRPLFSAGSTIAEARVQDGAERAVALIAERDIAVSVPKTLDPGLELNVVYDGPLRAPVAAGERVATLEIRIEGMETARVALLAAKDVGKAGFFGRIYNAV
ncbi:MAG: D-alanyl-D-alanine carboxypeptidase family protein, partial [Pseudomonadota bacterium]